MNLRPFLIPTFAMLAAAAVPAFGQYPMMKTPPQAQSPTVPAPQPTTTQAPAPAAAVPTAQQGSATETPLPAIPKPNCVAPEYPGKLAVNANMNSKISAFNRDYKAYGACIKKYVDDNRALIDAVVAANNKAVEEYNQFNANLKKQIDEAEEK